MKIVTSFTVYGAPVAQPRQRHRNVETNAGARFTQNYTPATHPVQQFKLDIKAAAQAAGLPPALVDGPLILECRFYVPRPASLMRKKDPDGPIRLTKKPDLDNLHKAVKDALSKVLWHDDSQICAYGPKNGKFYHEKDGRSRMELTLYSLEPGE